MADTLQVALAQPSDLDEVMELMTEVAQWLIQKGCEGQWPPVIPRDFIAASIERGEVYLARQGNQVVGTVTLQWSDLSMWGERPPDACYVHRLAIRRTHAGQGLGRELLRWAEQTALQQGKRYLRLDCWADNPFLPQYYTDAGFTYCGEVKVGTWRGCLFERPLQV